MALSTINIRRELANAAKTDFRRVHITPRSDGWAVRKEGNTQASKIVKTQEEAIRIGKKWVFEGKSSSVIIHFKDGKFRIANAV